MAFGQNKSPLGNRNRLVLIMGDDGVVLYAVEKKKAVRIVSLFWDAPDFDRKLISALKSGYNGDIVILYDAVEQHYRKDRIPKVGAMDKRKVIDRKLNLAFPNFVIKSSLPLKGAKKKGLTIKADDAKAEYLFAALPRSEMLTRIVSVLYEVEIGIVGLGLLPVESVGLVDELASRCIVKKRAVRSKWTVMIGQHETGGLYQIVTHNGNLAMRRLTPVADSANGGIAGDVIREFKATLSYIARFGYSAKDGIDLIVIAAKGEHNALSMANLPVANLCLLDLPDALDMVGGRYEGESVKTYADPLHALWSAKSAKLVMPMKIAELQKVSMPRKIAQLLVIVSIFGMLGLLYLNYTGYSAYADHREMIEFKTTQLNALTREHEQETAVFEQLPMQPTTVNNILEIKNMLQKNSIDTVPVLEVLYNALNANFIVETMSIAHTPDEESSLAAIGAAPGGGGISTAVQNLVPGAQPVDTSRGNMTVEFVIRTNATGLPLEQMVILSEGLLESLQLALPNHTVEVVRQFGGVSRTGAFSVVAGDDEAQRPPGEEDLTAEFRIEGPPL